ncbi:aldo/keto reductase [Candidatus Binatia bacterium]|jgi:diketogulonate reductase-like aldo/keto reductase|nr:aldo/keto reductase [Candidatus Binatia bacterium]
MKPADPVQKRPFGPHADAVPWLGQGTWQLEQAPRDGAIAALRRGFELGLVHVDTAEMYGDGRVEEIVGEAIEGFRERLFLVSKVLPKNATRDGTIAACERSLRRLGTDRLDCYLLHWPSSHPLEETLRAFDELERAGKIRSFGVSNFHAGDIDAAVGLAGAGRVACNQVRYHLDDRGIERDDVARCAKHGIAVVGYSPFEGESFLSRRHAGGRLVADIAAAHGATPRRVALAFLGGFRGVFQIPKAASLAHVEDNAAAAALHLSDDEMRRLDAAFPVGPAPRARL